MKIGIDARELGGRPTGVGRYLSELLLAWDQLPDARRHRFILYSSRPAPSLPDALRTRVERSDFMTLRHLPGSGGVLWEQWTLPTAANRDQLDGFFAPAYSAPIRLLAPLTLTIHDLSFVAHPEWFGLREGVRRRSLTRGAARRAQIVLTDSEFSRQQIVELLGISPGRVRVIRLGVRPAPSAPPRPREPLVLFAGSIFNRRRIPDLIAAFAMFAGRHPTARLALVGENRTHPRQDLTALASAAGIPDRVDVHEYVPDTVLADLYARASVFVFLSEYEGFGFTPLEALSAGVPVVIGDTPIAREVHGDAATFVKLGDIHATAAAIETLLLDPGARQAQLASAAVLLPAYSWPRAAEETLHAITGTAATRS